MNILREVASLRTAANRLQKRDKCELRIWRVGQQWPRSSIAARVWSPPVIAALFADFPPRNAVSTRLALNTITPGALKTDAELSSMLFSNWRPINQVAPGPWRGARSQRTRAFTLVELLVVIAIIGILVALLLPAIQAAREAARRISCQNNLHNLALAIVNYENQQKALPPATQAKAGTGGGGERLNIYNGQQLSWIVQVLPFIEEQALYDQFDLTKSAMGQDTNLKPQENQPDLLLCPSDSSRGRFYNSTFTFGRRFAKGNYAAYVSPEHAVCMRVFPGAMINEKQSMAKITDGTSHTLMITEVRTRDHESDQRGAWTLAWVATSLLSFDFHSENATLGCDTVMTRNSPYIPVLSPADQAQPPNNPPGAWNNDKLRDCPDKAAAALELMPCDTEPNTTFISAAPRSQHVGGVNAAYVDGSVAWIANDINPYLMARMVSINDSQGMVEGYQK